MVAQVVPANATRLAKMRLAILNQACAQSATLSAVIKREPAACRIVRTTPQSAMLWRALISSSPTITSAFLWTNHIRSARAVHKEHSIRSSVGLNAAATIPIRVLAIVRFAILRVTRMVMEAFEVLAAGKTRPETPQNAETHPWIIFFTMEGIRAS